MKRKKRVWGFGLAAVLMMGALAGCGNQAETHEQAETEKKSEEPVVLVYTDVNSIDSLDGKVAQYFKEQVETLTDGMVSIDIQASGVLGSEADILDGMVSNSGTVDLVRTSIFALNNYGCKKSALMGVPFTFESRDHYWKFTETDLAQEILDEPSENGLGIQGLYYMEEGFRNYFFTKEVAEIKDLKGRKIRVSSDPILTGTTEQLGASPTVIAFNELYTSLQSGVVDGGDQPTALYESNAFHEVAPYLLKDQHTISASGVYMSEASIKKLSDEQMEAILKAGKATSQYCKEISEEEEKASEARLKDAGATIVEVVDFAPWREACEDVIKERTSELEAEYQTILDSAK